MGIRPYKAHHGKVTLFKNCIVLNLQRKTKKEIEEMIDDPDLILTKLVEKGCEKRI